jgi:hypothetical protein
MNQPNLADFIWNVADTLCEVGIGAEGRDAGAQAQGS